MNYMLECENYPLLFGILAGCIIVGSLIGNLLFMYIDNMKRRKKRLDGGCCAICKYHAMTLMTKWQDEKGNVYVDENSGYVCTNPKSGCKNTSLEFRCKHFKR